GLSAAVSASQAPQRRGPCCDHRMGPKELAELAQAAQRLLDRPEAIFVRRPDHHCRLFRRRHRDPRRADRLRLFALSEHPALARQREETADLVAGQSGILRAARDGQGAELRARLTPPDGTGGSIQGDEGGACSIFRAWPMTDCPPARLPCKVAALS